MHRYLCVGLSGDLRLDRCLVIGYTGATVFASFVQIIAAVVWTLQIYSLSAFSLRLVISAVDWTHLCGELDILDFIHAT